MPLQLPSIGGAAGKADGTPRAAEPATASGLGGAAAPTGFKRPVFRRRRPDSEAGAVLAGGGGEECAHPPPVEAAAVSIDVAPVNLPKKRSNRAKKRGAPKMDIAEQWLMSVLREEADSEAGEEEAIHPTDSRAGLS